MPVGSLEASRVPMQGDGRERWTQAPQRQTRVFHGELQAPVPQARNAGRAPLGSASKQRDSGFLQLDRVAGGRGHQLLAQGQGSAVTWVSTRDIVSRGVSGSS